jgi:hypothetical protein
VRQAKLGRGGREELKPLEGAQRESKPVRQRLATRRYRVLRGVTVTWAAKRTQGVHEPRDGASKAFHARVGVVSFCADSTEASQWA